MSPKPFSDVIWIRLEKPTFDLVGVLVSSFGITGVCVAVALGLGACCGALLIRRSRARRPYEPEFSLGLRAEARS